MLRDAESVGPQDAWAWTSTAEGLGPERIDRTADAETGWAGFGCDGGAQWTHLRPP